MLLRSPSRRLAMCAMTLVTLSLLLSVAGFGSRCGAGAATADHQQQQQHVHRLRRVQGQDLWPQPNTRIAILGDQGLTEDAQDLLHMIKDWDADAIVHLGDFDYTSSPHAFIAQIDRILGHDYPYFAVIGNHDLPKWEGENGYKELLIDKLKRFGGDKNCTGTFGTGHSKYISNVLSNSTYLWKVCGWHKNQRLFQTGMKADEVGYEIYDTCRRMGAIIATAHEHSFCRTHLMSSFENQTIASTSNQLVVEPGHTFSFVSGLGGDSVRSFHGSLEKLPWMAASAAANNDARAGALLCTFHIRGNPHLAKCIFKDIQGRLYDEFTVKTPKHSSVETSHAKKSQETLIVHDKTCQKAIELTLSSKNGIRSTNRHDNESDKILLAKNQLHELIFELDRSILEGFDVKHVDIKHAHLQVMGAPNPKLSSLSMTYNPGKTSIQLTSSYHQREQSSVQSVFSRLLSSLKFTANRSAFMNQPRYKESLSVVQWGAHNDSEDEWEIHEVWVSPDISSLIREQVHLLKLTKESDKVQIAVQMRTEGVERWIYGWAQDGCLSPTLALYVNVC